MTDSISGTRKKRDQILAIQIISQVFYGAASFVLKGYSGVAQNVVAILRNVAAIKNLEHKVIEWILVALGVLLGVVGIILSHNALGWLDWLPIAANLEYSVAMFRFRDNDRALKIAFIINVFAFCVFNFFLKNFVGGIADAVVCVLTLISVIRNGKKSAPDTDESEKPDEQN